MKSAQHRFDIASYRPNPEVRQWDIPSWGHPLGQWVFPLMIHFGEKLFPIGTAFSIGSKINFAVTALHNIREALKHEAGLKNWELSGSIKLTKAGFYLLHQAAIDRGRLRFNLWPLESVSAVPPSDVVVGYPQFDPSIRTLSSVVSFDLPSIAQTVWSIGYSDFKFPEGGIPFDAIRDHRFDWLSHYRHRLRVVEGTIEKVFVQRFTLGYVDGPCFAFDGEISHAMSGGPIMTTDGTILGANAASASSFFNKPTSIGSLLYPMLAMRIKYGASFGKLRLNASRSFLEMIAAGFIKTDGSEQRVGYRQGEMNQLHINPRLDPRMDGHIHDDFHGYQAGSKATRQKQPLLILTRKDAART